MPTPEITSDSSHGCIFSLERCLTIHWAKPVHTSASPQCFVKESLVAMTSSAGWWIIIWAMCRSFADIRVYISERAYSEYSITKSAPKGAVSRKLCCWNQLPIIGRLEKLICVRHSKIVFIHRAFCCDLRGTCRKACSKVKEYAWQVLSPCIDAVRRSTD